MSKIENNNAMTIKNIANEKFSIVKRCLPVNNLALNIEPKIKSVIARVIVRTVKVLFMFYLSFAHNDQGQGKQGRRHWFPLKRFVSIFRVNLLVGHGFRKN